MTSREALIAALAWQAEMGVDEAIGQEPVDRFAAPSPAAAVVKAAEADTIASADDHGALISACETLESLKALLEAFDHPLKKGAQRCVFADGNPAARVMIIGEAPGRDEDRAGLPFVGRSGQLLDRMLGTIGLERHTDDIAKAVYIANILPWRPPSNRTPDAAEINAFLPFITRHIDLADPDILILSGGVSAKTLLETTTGIMRLRGQWASVSIGGRSRMAMPTLHPAYLLRNPAAKRYAWADLRAIRRKLDGVS